MNVESDEELERGVSNEIERFLFCIVEGGTRVGVIAETGLMLKLAGEE